MGPEPTDVEAPTFILEEEIGHLSRTSKVEWCLAVAAAPIDSGRILCQPPQTNVGSIEVRSRSTAGNRAGREPASR